MLCGRCGTNNNVDATFCSSCGINLQQESIQYVAPQEEQLRQHVENYLVFSILTTILCCLPLGIVAIIKSTQVDKELAAGNYQAALEASKQAKMLNIISAIVAGVSVLIWVILVIFLNFIPFLMLV